MPKFRVGPFAVAAVSLLTIMVAAPAPSHAQDDPRARGEKACGGDAARLCRKVLKEGDFVVLSCFQENKAKLSAGCKKFLTEQGQL